MKKIPGEMQAMTLHGCGQPLKLESRKMPDPAADEVLIRVSACAVCRTDLHVVDGDLDPVVQPIVPGHEVVGYVEQLGREVRGFRVGQRVGVPWLAGTCGACRYCLEGQENLCDAPEFTGYTRDGGFATHLLARAAFCLPLDALPLDDIRAAPVLCAGLIGWRSLMMAGDASCLGLYGFGAAAHLVAQVAIARGQQVFAFTRAGDESAQEHARSLGATWAGASNEPAPLPLDAAIIFAPVGALVPVALEAVRKGGCVVCGGIHMSDIPSFRYERLWGERQLRSVANLTRADGRAFLAQVRQHPVQVDATQYRLDQANEALDDLRQGHLRGAAVLVP